MKQIATAAWLFAVSVALAAAQPAPPAPPPDPRVCPAELEMAGGDAAGYLALARKNAAMLNVCNRDLADLRKQVEDLKKQLEELKPKDKP